MRKKLSILAIILSFCAVVAVVAYPYLSRDGFRTYSHDSIYSAPVMVSGNNPSNVADALLDSCVTICVENSGNVVSFGSGVCIYAGGYIVTNHHVVKNFIDNGVYDLKTYLNGSTNGLETKLLWHNSTIDVAIVQCNEANIPYVNVVDRVFECQENQKLKVLEQVIAIGTPIDVSFQNWCTIGEIAKLDCHSYANGNLYENLIGHTASINHGNSGGGLFDLNGNLIALNTLGDDDAHSMFFAIPIYPLLKVIERVVTLNEGFVAKKLQTPVLGVKAYDGLKGYYNQEEFNIDDEGVYIDEVVEGSASYGNLFVGDILLEIKNGDKTYKITDSNSLVYALISCDVGDTVKITVKRNTENITVNVTLAS